MKKLQTTAILFCLALFGITGYTQAQQPGTIDSSFATNGVLKLIPNPFGTDVANDLYVLPNDKVLLAGITDVGGFMWDACVYRIMPNGTVDSTFGTNGLTVFDIGGGEDYTQAMAVLPNGKIIVAGGSYLGGAEVDFFAARLTEDGQLDASFGNNGKVIIPISAGEAEDVAQAIAIQPDGKIILAGSYGIFNTTDTHTALVRLNENGTLDNTFGTNGIAFQISNYGDDVANDVMLLEDGSILTTGYADVLNQQVIVTKTTANGIPDATFGENGIAYYDLNSGSDVGWSIGRHPNGKLMVSGRKGNTPGKTDFMLMAITENGALDNSFGINGVASKNQLLNDAALDMIFEPSGKIVLAGSSGGSLLGSNDFSICRFNEDGSIDATFGTGGVTVSDIASFFSEAAAVGMQSDGKLIVAGRASDTNNDFGVVRYFSDPLVVVCEAPENLTTTQITSSSATLSWGNPANATNFQVRYRGINDAQWTKLYVSATTVTINNLIPGSKYAWGVKASCDNGVSSFSKNVKFKTLPQRIGEENSPMEPVISVYPNPTSGHFQLSFSTGSSVTSTAAVQIINIYGQVVESLGITLVDGRMEHTFDLSGKLAAGTYFLTIAVDGTIHSSRIVLQ